MQQHPCILSFRVVALPRPPSRYFLSNVGYCIEPPTPPPGTSIIYNNISSDAEKYDISSKRKLCGLPFLAFLSTPTVMQMWRTGAVRDGFRVQLLLGLFSFFFFVKMQIATEVFGSARKAKLAWKLVERELIFGHASSEEICKNWVLSPSISDVGDLMLCMYAGPVSL